MSANQPVQVTSDERKLLTVLDGMWPSWHSCSRLAAELGFRSARLWPALTRLRKVGLVESQERVWQAEGVVYEVWRRRIETPADLGLRKEEANPFIPQEGR